MTNPVLPNNTIALVLFPDILLASDSKRLCFINLNTGRYFILAITNAEYDFQGNVLIIKDYSETMISQIEILESNDIVYKLCDCPATILGNKLHSIPVESIHENTIVLSTLFLVTIVLDFIPELPAFHYPELIAIPGHKFSSARLNMNSIHSIISQLRCCRRIRLLGSDILNHDIIYLPELEYVQLEAIVDYQYYISHLGDIAMLRRPLSISVYIKDIKVFDDRKRVYPNNENVSVNFYWEVHDIEELDALTRLHVKITPYPSTMLSKQLAHAFLDYSEKELLQIKIVRRQLFFNKVLNTNFYGNVIIDNDGNINSFPFVNYHTNNHCRISQVIPEIKQNRYWYLTREKFFKKCCDCVFSTICPPLSNYEINSKETFCPY